MTLDDPLWARALSKRHAHQRALQAAEAAERALAQGPLAERILTAVASRYCVTVEALCGPRRFSTLAQARAVAYWLLRQRGFSYPEIGRAIGGRDHTTAMAGVRKVDRMRAASTSYADAVDELAASIATRPGPAKVRVAVDEEAQTG